MKSSSDVLANNFRVNVVEANGRQKRDWLTCEIGRHLYFDTAPLASYFFAEWEPVIFDAMVVAAAVEFCDRLKRRPSITWRREIQIHIPVHDPSRWSASDVNDSLKAALDFLTGDSWSITFVARNAAAARPAQLSFELPAATPLAVIPFSDGLDSCSVAGLVGHDWGNGLIRVRLENRAIDRRDGRRKSGEPFTAMPYQVRHKEYRFSESSARSRGFKFAVLSGIAAYLAKAERIFLPESGQGAIGPVLVGVGQAYEDYRNHPAFTRLMTKFLGALLNFPAAYEFPRLWFTKGETLRTYVDKADNSVGWTKTQSCWHDNRRVSVNGKRRQCGICAACMLRRLSVHAAGLEEAADTYVWENLGVKNFVDGAAKVFVGPTKSHREYAIAGILHMKHLAALADSGLRSASVKARAIELARALGLSEDIAQVKLQRLLQQHKKEWTEFMSSLPTDSFIVNWAAE